MINEDAARHKLSRIYNQQNDIYMKLVRSGWCHDHAYGLCYSCWEDSIDRLKERIIIYEND